MKILKFKSVFYIFTAFFCLILLFPAAANAQRRDYLTDEEVELVRDAQEIDLRIEVLSKAVDRRFLVINNDTSQSKKVEKDLDKWGELPKGTRGEMLSDIKKILQKAIDDIDDVAAHDKMEEKLFPKAVFALTDACQSYIPKLKILFDSVNDEKEKGLILGSIDNCRQVIEASAKVPKVESKDKKEKKKKS